MKQTLGAIVNAIDTQIRTAVIDAHQSTAVAIAQQAPVPGMPEGSTMPRDTLQPTRVTLDFSLYISDDGATFARCRGGVRSELRMEWHTTAIPEALSLVRTRAESNVVKE